MAEAILYQSVIQKLGQLNPNDLSQLDAFLSTLIGQKKPKKSSKKAALSPVDCLEQLAKETKAIPQKNFFVGLQKINIPVDSVIIDRAEIYNENF